MLGVLVAELIEHGRRLRHHLSSALVLGIEGPQRIGVDPLAHLLGEIRLVGAQVGAKLLEVGGTGAR